MRKIFRQTMDLMGWTVPSPALIEQNLDDWKDATPEQRRIIKKTHEEFVILVLREIRAKPRCIRGDEEAKFRAYIKRIVRKYCG